MKFKPLLLSGNALKLIAALTMLIDHIGMILFPNVILLRVIGRLSFPIYAFMIAEGCRHTRNKLRYFLSVFSLALICQIAMYIYANSLFMCILVTFSLSILCIYAFRYMKKTVMLEESSNAKKLGSIAAFFAAFIGAYLFCQIFEVDYGFFGVMIPACTAIFETEDELPRLMRPLGIERVRVIMLGLALTVFVAVYGGIRNFALFALIPMLLYSGRRGRFKMKYFFYVFYPAHLLILYFLAYILNR